MMGNNLDTAAALPAVAPEATLDRTCDPHSVAAFQTHCFVVGIPQDHGNNINAASWCPGASRDEVAHQTRTTVQRPYFRCRSQPAAHHHDVEIHDRSSRFEEARAIHATRAL